MSSFLRLSSRIRTPVSSAYLGRPLTSLPGQRCYVHSTPNQFDKANEHDLEEDCDRGNTPNHPIPSNKAHPTLRDGRQSNLADMEGKKHEELPEDVRKHNEEMENRYDKPYNHIADEGPVEKAFEAKKEKK
ncbi:uncharacterized protein N7484_006219 [Penicillium longicatenatum]|uniref:uncharacterized protein n=1 Tax=Penicillium longicatenatum TaxID=1561947 RepID=UPI002548B34F|nr:uncharacterized protein N7484_006219 [Penicillium longicatenatum]KAJ5643712.1 hypothetical protein N7484_006219 [Penicillium longicatenatum]